MLTRLKMIIKPNRQTNKPIGKQGEHGIRCAFLGIGNAKAEPVQSPIVLGGSLDCCAAQHVVELCERVRCECVRVNEIDVV